MLKQKVLGSAFGALLWEESIIFCSTWNIWTAKCLKASVRYSYSAVQFISRNCPVWEWKGMGLHLSYCCSIFWGWKTYNPWMQQLPETGFSMAAWEENQVLRISGEVLPMCIQIHTNDFTGVIFRLHYCVWWVEPSQQSSQPPAHSPTLARWELRRYLWTEIKTV